MEPYIDKRSGYIIDPIQKLIFVSFNDEDRNPICGKDGKLIYAYTDLNNYDLIAGKKFHVLNNNGGIYAYDAKNISMHEIIFGQKAPNGYLIDHSNTNTLDNRSSNLRLATYGQNAHNRKKIKNATTQYFGIHKNSNTGKWRATIRFERETYYLGEYDDILKAVKVHDAYALYFYKEYARINRDESENFILTEGEILDILKNGVPDKFKYINRKKCTTRCVYKKTNLWCYAKTFRKKQYYKSYKTRKEAEEGLSKLMEWINSVLEKEKVELSGNIIRSKNGVAVLYTRDKEGNINGEFLVDDHVWKELVHYSWSRRRNYAGGIYKGREDSLHVHVYKNFIGEIKEGYSVDHISTDKFDTRISNLRLGNPSLQSHNRIIERKTCLRYTGVTIDSGKFSCYFKSKFKGRFDTEEEAAEEYNKLAKMEYGEDARLNRITTSGTTMKYYFNNNTITVDFVKSINTVKEIKQIFAFKKEWTKKLGIKYYKIRKKDLETCKNFAIKMLKEDKMSLTLDL